MDAPERTARRIAMLSLGVSAALAAVKISVGLAAHSVAVVSDGVESAGDCLSSGLVLLGLWVASKPPDSDHPYGHGRFETLTGLAIGACWRWWEPPSASGRSSTELRRKR